MSENVANEVDHLSVSHINCYEKCGMQAYFRYQLGLKVPPAFAMIQGTAFHLAEEVNFKQKIATGEDIKLSVAKDAFVEKYQEEVRSREALLANQNVTAEDEEEQSSPVEFENQGLSCLELFHTRYAPRVMPKESEKEFSIEINGLGKPVNLLVRLDLVANVFKDFEAGKTLKTGEAIIDLKLQSKAPKQEDVDRSEQLGGYAEAWKALTGKYPKQVALLATVKKKSPEVVYVQSREFGEEHGKRFLRRVARVAEAEAKGIYTPAPSMAWWCSKKWCGFYNLCEFGGKK